MKKFDENLKKCKDILPEAAELEPGKYLKNDSENNILIIRNNDGCVIGLMDGSEWIHCYEFKGYIFIRYEPMTHGDMDWALSVAKTL